MRERQCEPVRRELDELVLNDEPSTTTAEHLQTCADCRDFQQQQNRLRQIVGSLGTVNAPADFDYRLRARLAAESQPSGFRYWYFAVKGMATAAVLVAFGVGGAVVWQRAHQQTPVAPVAVAPPAPRIEQPKPDTPKSGSTPASQVTPAVAVNKEPKQKPERPFVVRSKRAPLTAVDFSSERANVVSNAPPAVNVTVFPIEASVQSVKVSLDDGRGNARTISFPPVSFGSQRVLTSANQLAPKGIW